MVPELDEDLLKLLSALSGKLAGRALPASIAKLYSQFTRLNANQPSLKAWRPDEAHERLHEAVLLVDAGLLKRQATLPEPGKDHRPDLLRAAEILEWLSHRDIRPSGVPVALLAGAAYQLAGYPARSASLTSLAKDDDQLSDILRSFVRADFQDVTNRLLHLWAQMDRPLFGREPIELRSGERFSERLHEWVVWEVASSIGALLSWIRWGDDDRLEKAQGHLDTIADVMLHSSSPYSWLTAKLCAEVAKEYARKSLRRNVASFLEGPGARALERYVRLAFQSNRSLAWPSQLEGLRRLATGESFALCTPTGSGKTAVAEIALILSLFQEERESLVEALGSDAPLALYLVPSRALAAEVESKLDAALRPVAGRNLVVTGLYGGIDWGPTDAWLTRNQPTVLICTHEKAEALLRFLGPQFLQRLSLVILDEAHNVQVDASPDEGQARSMLRGENRSLRLESVMARLLTIKGDTPLRTIALSAVVTDGNSLDRWVGQRRESRAVEVEYWSTRRLVGRLLCRPGDRFELWYDLLDGALLKFSEQDETDGPYVLDPFPPMPKASDRGSGIDVRARPLSLWAAMSMAASGGDGHGQSVLISVPQRPEWYAQTFLDLLTADWRNTSLPEYFTTSSKSDKELFDATLEMIADYFGTNSLEYQLLQRGIALHRGGLPPRLSRALVDLVEKRTIRLTLATSTLSEGMNLPFDVVVVPSLARGKQTLPVREFANLAGRAGRPGRAGEGRCLVVMMDPKTLPREKHYQAKGALEKYRTLVNQLATPSRQPTAGSPIEVLTTLIHDEYLRLPAHLSFEEWLEQTVPAEDIADLPTQYLDTLDGVLLANIAEAELASTSMLSAADIESRLLALWQHTYANYASQAESECKEILSRRGSALFTTVYPTVIERRRLYRTSLPPRFGKRLLTLYPSIRDRLRAGGDYAIWEADKRFEYVASVVEAVRDIPSFRSDNKYAAKVKGWRELLGWWLRPGHPNPGPKKDDSSTWYRHVNDHFIYRFNWGLGSILALALDEAHGGLPAPPSLTEWPRTGLPWVAFWLKELIVWGTLDPVAAYLLANGLARTRKTAEASAQNFYRFARDTATANELLNPNTIQAWAQDRYPESHMSSVGNSPPIEIEAMMMRDFSAALDRRFRVLPVQRDGELYWTDPAGYTLAKSTAPGTWDSLWATSFDFVLDAKRARVITAPY